MNKNNQPSKRKKKKETHKVSNQLRDLPALLKMVAQLFQLQFHHWRQKYQSSLDFTRGTVLQGLTIAKCSNKALRPTHHSCCQIANLVSEVLDVTLKPVFPSSSWETQIQ